MQRREDSKRVFYPWLVLLLLVSFLVIPVPTAVAEGTTVEVGSASVALGATTQVSITVKNFTAAGGFGSYNFKLSFKPEGIQIDSVKAGDQPFGEPAAANIDNAKGMVLLNDFHSQVPGPKGNIVVANVVVKGVAAGSWSLALTIVDLVAVDGADVPATVVNGTITVAGTPVTPTATPTAAPTPTATPTPAPTPTPVVTPLPTVVPEPTPTPVVTAPLTPKPSPMATTPPPKPTPSPTPPPPPAPTTNWGLIIGVIVLVIVVIIVLVLVFRRKPTKPTA